MEAGLGFRQTTAMVNQQRREEGRLVVGRSCVMLHFTKMQPKICKIKKCSQGNTSNKAWQTARYNQTLQYLIMLKDLNKQDLITHFKTYPLPTCFEPTLLPSIDRSQIVFWDETHIAQEGGMPSRTGVSIRFPRDNNGQLNLDFNDNNPVRYNDEPKK
jgi:hypothetical protein